MSRFNLGIDTGGTYTDAVVVDLDTRSIVASAKAITTLGNLSIGVSNALRAVLDKCGEDLPRAEISLVSVSTTLATNALVEGQGSPVAAILVGFDDAMVERTRILEAVPDARIIRINGGHSHTGEEAMALDEAALVEAIHSLTDKVAAYSVASMYSVRNASHEHRAEQVIRELTAAPVTASSELSDELDGPRRALTATLNARIISRIVALIAAVRESLAREAIDARLMIVKGDGSLASADLVARRPIETILSGPAASVIGARYLSELQDFIISDIGGTTTDIAIARNGWPDISSRGSVVGDYRTLVKAIDMRTIGLGGDSEVRTDFNGTISLAVNRVVPVSLLGAKWPSVKAHLQAVLRAGSGFRSACRFLLLPEGTDKKSPVMDLPTAEARFLSKLSEEPTPWGAAIDRISEEKIALHLASSGLIQIGGFTPSDAAHSLHLQQQWCTETAALAAQIMGRSSNHVSRNNEYVERDVAAFCHKVVDVVVRKSCHVLIERLADRRFALDDPLVSAVTSGERQTGGLGVRLRPELPVVAVGGPANIYYPEVASRLATDAVIPEHHAVANAIGAATGLIKVLATIEITACDDGGYFIHVADTPEKVMAASAALARAEQQARAAAEQRASAMGARQTTIRVDIQRVDIPDSIDDLGLIAATISAECIGHVS